LVIGSIFDNSTSVKIFTEVPKKVQLMGLRRVVDMGSDMGRHGYKGSVRCPVWEALGSSQAVIDRHIIRKRDPAHIKAQDMADSRLKVIGSRL